MSCEASFTAKDFLALTGALIVLLLLLTIWLLCRLLLMFLLLLTLVIGGVVRVIDCFSRDL